MPAARSYTNAVDVCRSYLVSFLLIGLLCAGLGCEKARALAPLFPAPPFAEQQVANPSVLVCFGDSITAGYGLPPGDSYPDFLQRKLDAAGYHYKVINRGTSGATTKDAVADVHSIVLLHPAIVVVEFGGNDGLRGLPLSETHRNLDQVLTALEAAHIKVLLAGITLPPNYGPDYIREFEKVFHELAAQHHVAFVPMIYVGLVHQQGVIQGDGIHPTAKGSNIIADTLMGTLKPLLKK
jgi:acyl-CoA thioesterase-1